MRQAAVLARLLQDSPAVAGGGTDGRHLVETALAGIGRVLEARIEQRSDPARSEALGKASTALAQALVGGGSAAPCEPSEALQRLIVGPDDCNDVDWQGARAAGVLPLLGATQTSCCIGPASLSDLATLALHAPALGDVSGKPSPLLQAAYELAPALPRGTDRSSWTAHLLLRPQALTELLEAVLHGVCGVCTPSLSTLRAALALHPDWAAGLSAVAAHPALLLPARATLRSWLATSGSIAAWMLHWELFRLGTSGSSAASWALYPGPLRAAAAGVHAANQSILKNDSDGPDVSNALAEVQRALEGAAGDACLREEVWALALDAPALAAAVLDQLQWSALLLEADEDDADGDAMDAEGASGCCTVEGAEWLAALAWPFAGQTGQRQELATALMDGRAVTATARAGVAALARWRAAWPLAQLKEG
jgi:hypothetical protein